jgi:succinate-acetate transporter protein
LIATVLVLFLLFLALAIARLAGNAGLKNIIKNAIGQIFSQSTPA